MLERDVNFQSLSKLADANINRACLIGDDTEIRYNTRSLTNLMFTIQTKAKTVDRKRSSFFPQSPARRDKK